MTETDNQLRKAVIGGLILTAVTTVVFVIADGWASGLIVMFLLLAFIATVYFGRNHSETLAILSSTGDERTRSLYQRALSITANVMVYILVGWWLVSLAAGNVNETVNLITAIFGVVFLGAIGWVRWRG